MLECGRLAISWHHRAFGSSLSERGDGRLARIFYRGVRDGRPREPDFLSHVALGRFPKSNSPQVRRSWEGVSVFDTYEQARANAEQYDWKIGEFVAELVIADDVPLTVDGPGRNGHSNLYDIPASVLLSYVRRVFHGPTTRHVPRPSSST